MNFLGKFSGGISFRMSYIVPEHLTQCTDTDLPHSAAIFSCSMKTCFCFSNSHSLVSGVFALAKNKGEII